MSRFGLWSVVVLCVLGAAVAALAQVPPPQPSCEEQLDNELFQKGAIMQQLAVARAQLRVMTKERDDAKTAVAKGTPKPAQPEKK